MLKTLFVCFILFLGLTFTNSAFAGADTVTLSGQVTDGAASPISNSQISVADSTSGTNVGTVMTDPSGSYSLSFAPGTYTITVTPPSSSGLQSVVQFDQVITSNTTLNFTLVAIPEEFTVSGYIFHHAGNPAIGVSISVGGPSGVGGATTDTNGFYSLQIPAGNSYSLSIAAAASDQSLPGNTLTTTNGHNLSISANTILDVTLPEVHTFTTKVLDPPGNPVSGAGLFFEVLGGGIPVSSTIGNLEMQVGKKYTNGSTDNNGNYSLLAYTSSANINITSPTSTLLDKSISTSITGDTVFPITLALAPIPVTVNGHIFDHAGNPVQGMVVDIGGSGGSVQAITDTNGFYSVQIVEGNNYNLSLVASPDNPSLPSNTLTTTSASHFSVNGNMIFDITLPEVHTFTTKVVDPSGESVVGAGVSFEVLGGGIPVGSNVGNLEMQVGKRNISGMTDREGTYTLLAYTSSATIHVTSPTSTLQNTTVATTITDSTTFPIQLAIAPIPVTVTGHIFDNGGSPVFGVSVSLSSQTSSGEGTTDSDGFYSFQVIAGKSYALSLAASSAAFPGNTLTMRGSNNISITGDTTLVVTLPKVHRLTVKVLDPSGEGVVGAGLSFEVLGPAISVASNRGTLEMQVGKKNISGTTDNEGNYSLFAYTSDATVNVHSPINSLQNATVNIAVTQNTTQIISLQYATPTPSPTLTPTVTPSPTPTRTPDVPSPTPTNTPTPTVIPRQLTSLSPARVWMAKAVGDAGLKLDILAEVYKGSTLVSSGQTKSVTVGSGIFALADLITVPFNSFSPTNFPAGTQLKIKVSARNACTGSLRNQGTARLWFNDSQANSSFDATIATVNRDYYLRNGFALTTTVGTGPRQTIDIQAGAKCSAFKSFGTWTVTP